MAEYIKREDVVKRLENLFQLQAVTAKAIVNAIPAADVKPVVRGEWEMKPDHYGFFEEIPVCSVCGCTTKMRETYSFCPNCGADMRDAEDG